MRVRTAHNGGCTDGPPGDSRSLKVELRAERGGSGKENGHT